MWRVSILFGLILVGLGLYGYFGSMAETPSLTSLIPAAVGAPLILCGLLAINDGLRKHAMHAAAAIALLGALAAGGRGLTKVGVLFADDPAVDKRPVALVLSMAVLCLLFVGLCVQSFIAARRRREANQGTS